MAEQALTKRYGSAKNARRSVKGGGGNGVLRRLKADEVLKVRFLQEPEDWEEGYYHYLNGKFQWCNRTRKCDGCRSQDRARKIVLANAVDLEKGQVVIMQMPPTLADQVLKRYDKWETVMDRDYELSREGSGQNDTRYSVDYDPPKKRNLDRYELHDIAENILAEIGDDDEDEDDDEEPRSTKGSRSKGKAAARRVRRQDEDDDEDDFDDDDTDDEDEDEDDDYTPRSRRTKTPARAARRKSRHPDEDDEDEEEDPEDDEDVEDERPRRSVKKTKGGGLKEFKKSTTSNPRVRTVRRAAR